MLESIRVQESEKNGCISAGGRHMQNVLGAYGRCKIVCEPACCLHLPRKIAAFYVTRCTRIIGLNLRLNLRG
jgi:hypothetical protein